MIDGALMDEDWLCTGLRLSADEARWIQDEGVLFRPISIAAGDYWFPRRGTGRIRRGLLGWVGEVVRTRQQRTLPSIVHGPWRPTQDLALRAAIRRAREHG